MFFVTSVFLSDFLFADCSLHISYGYHFSARLFSLSVGVYSFYWVAGCSIYTGVSDFSRAFIPMFQPEWTSEARNMDKLSDVFLYDLYRFLSGSEGD